MSVSSDHPLQGFATIPESAKLAHKSEFTINRYIREGRLKKYKIVGSATPYVKISDLVPKPVAGPVRRAK